MGRYAIDRRTGLPHVEEAHMLRTLARLGLALAGAAALFALPAGARPAAAAIGVDNYPDFLKQAAQDSVQDPTDFPNRECTSFVGWRVRVAFTPAVTSANCQFWFYVPDGHATATVIFGYWNTAGNKFYKSIDENPVTGWQHLFDAANVRAVNFQDNNGGSGTQIGWSSHHDFGLWQVC
jgi:hypothetical protein